MPFVKLSTSDILKVDGCFVGNAVLLGLNGTSTVPSFPSDTRPLSANNDFLRTAAGLEPSDRGWAGALVFFTTIGGTDWSRELMAESGRGPEDVLDLDGGPPIPLDGVPLCPFGGKGGTANTTDPASEVALRRRPDCLVGCAYPGSRLGVPLLANDCDNI